MGEGRINIHIQNLLLFICCCAGRRCDRGCHRNANYYPNDTWDRPRVIISGAVSPSGMGHDNGIRPVE